MRSFILLLVLICGIEFSSAKFNAEKDIVIKHFTNKNEKSIKYNLDNGIKIDIDGALRTVIFFHGYFDPITIKELMKAAYFSGSKQAAVNLIGINWGAGARHPQYAKSAKRVKEVGNYTAVFISNLIHTKVIKMDDITLVGHSLGAQCASFASKFLAERGHKKKVPVIIGLDPARPAFEVQSPDLLGAQPILMDNKLKASDAVKVLIIHTNPGGFGYLKDAGTVDIYFRYKKRHPKCDFSWTNFFLKPLEALANRLNISNNKDNDAKLDDHIFAIKYLKDAVINKGPTADLFDLIKEYTLTIPNAIVNDENNKCQYNVVNKKLNWPEECTNAAKRPGDSYNSAV